MAVWEDWAIRRLPAAYEPIARVGDSAYRCQATISVTRLNDGRRVRFKMTHLSRFSDGNRLYGTYPSEVTPPGADLHIFPAVIGLNPRYLFHVERNARQDGWVLTKLLANDGTVNPAEHRDFRTLFSGGRLGEVISPALRLQPGRFAPAQLATLPGFTLRRLAIADDRRIEVEFSYRVRIGKFPDATADCRAVYDLSQYGLPVEHTETYPSGKFVSRQRTTTAVCGPSDGPFSVRRTTVTSQERDGKAVSSEESASDQTLTPGPVPAGEFTLTAFGLPEPPGMDEPGTPVAVWLAVAAAVGFGLFLLARWARRRAS
jgi:hypothetical protein